MTSGCSQVAQSSRRSQATSCSQRKTMWIQAHHPSLASASQSSNERSWKDVPRKGNSPLLNTQWVAAGRAAPLPCHVPFIDMGIQVERESRGEGVTGRWVTPGGRWEKGGERPGLCIYQVHPNTEGKAALLIQFAVHKLYRNTVINCCQSRLWGGRQQGKFGRCFASSIETRLSALTAAKGWPSTWLAPISQLWERGKIHLQMCRYDVLGENVTGDASASSSVVRQGSPVSARVFDEGLHQGELWGFSGCSMFLPWLNQYMSMWVPLDLVTASVVDLICALKYSIYFAPAARSTFDKGSTAVQPIYF